MMTDVYIQDKDLAKTLVAKDFLIKQTINDIGGYVYIFAASSQLYATLRGLGVANIETHEDSDSADRFNDFGLVMEDMKRFQKHIAEVKQKKSESSSYSRKHQLMLVSKRIDENIKRCIDMEWIYKGSKSGENYRALQNSIEGLLKIKSILDLEIKNCS